MVVFFLYDFLRSVLKGPHKHAAALTRTLKYLLHAHNVLNLSY